MSFSSTPSFSPSVQHETSFFFDKILTDVRKFLIKHELPTSTCGVNTIVENIYFEHIE